MADFPGKNEKVTKIFHLGTNPCYCIIFLNKKQVLFYNLQESKISLINPRGFPKESVWFYRIRRQRQVILSTGFAAGRFVLSAYFPQKQKMF